MQPVRGNPFLCRNSPTRQIRRLLEHGLLRLRGEGHGLLASLLWAQELKHFSNVVATEFARPSENHSLGRHIDSQELMGSQVTE